MSPAASPGGRRGEWLLAAGAAVGLAVAGFGLFEPPRPLPRGAVATVDDVPIRADLFAQAVNGFASDRRAPLDEADRRHVLDRLVEEELLVQRALELGLVRHERKIRGELVAAVIEAVVADASLGEPGPGELESFYAEHEDYFRLPARLRVREVRVRARSGETDAAAARRAQQAAERLRAGEPIASVARELGDPVVAAVPDTLLPVAKLGEYLGRVGLEAVLSLAPGAVADPVESPQGRQVLWLVEKEPGARRPLDDVRENVLAEWRRRASDAALRDYLDGLRRHADVRIADPLP